MSLTLLDRALIIAQHELDAMRQGDVDGAASFFKERGELMHKAMETQDEENMEDYQMKAMALQGYHQRIHAEGTQLLQQIKESLIHAKVNQRATQSYGMRRR